MWSSRVGLNSFQFNGVQVGLEDFEGDNCEVQRNIIYLGPFIFTGSDFGELFMVEIQILDKLLNKDSRMNWLEFSGQRLVIR